MRILLVFLAIICSSYSALYYDAHSGTPITKEELKRRDKANTTFWCVTELEPCDPNEGRRIDGSCNNLEHPTRGAGHTPFYKVLPSVYDKGFEPRKSKSGNALPLARVLRTRLLSEGRVPSLQFTQLAIHFLVFMSGDIVSQHDTVKYIAWKPYCCMEKGKTDRDCVPNKIPDDDPVHRFSNIRCLNMTRPESFQSIGCLKNDTVPDRITSTTPLLDLSVVYGSSNKAAQEKLRKFEGGLIKFEVSNGRIWPPSTKTQANVCFLNVRPHETRCHDTPDDGTNTLAGINLVTIWFWRMHNEIASNLAQVNPCWNDEKLFQTARDINIAIALQMYYYEVMPLLLGHDNLFRSGVITPSFGFRDIYDPNVIPQVSLEYPYVLRWLHTMQEGRMKLYDQNGYYLKEYPIVNLTLRTGFFDIDDNIDHMTQGSFRQGAAAADYIVDPDIAETGMGPHQKASDLGTNDVSKARYFGFQPYIKYREFCFGKPLKSFDDLADIIDPERLEILKENYEDVEDIDLIAGIWVERHIEGGHAPSTFFCLVVDQMLRNVVMDRHWYERPDRPNAFTFRTLRACPECATKVRRYSETDSYNDSREFYAQLLEIRKMTMARFLCNVGDSVTEIQPQAFLRPSPANSMQRCDQLGNFDYGLWKDLTCPTNVDSLYLQRF